MMHPPLAVSLSVVILLAIAIAAVVLLVLIIVAPWRRVREEPPLDKDVETRLLLRRPNPDEPTGEVPTARVTDINDRGGDVEAASADFTELRELDDH